MNILFVCTGNTCRSPMAEALLKEKMPEVNVQSAGVFAGTNDLAHDYTLQVLQQNNIEFTHQSQPVTSKLLDWAHLVLTMTLEHKQSLVLQYPDFQEKYFTLKEYVFEADKEDMLKIQQSEGNLANPNLSDPFGGTVEVYEQTFEELNTYIDLLIKKIK